MCLRTGVDFFIVCPHRPVLIHSEVYYVYPEFNVQLYPLALLPVGSSEAKRIGYYDNNTQ